MSVDLQQAAPLCLGIDTGGTYTDAVLWSETAGIVAKAKSLTTRHDLAEGIAGAVDAILREAATEPGAIKLVSMSTTLATNALVEGQGGRVALVMIGFDRADLDRAGLAVALGTDPVIFCPGGHDAHGVPNALSLDALEAALPSLEQSVSGVAVAAYFAVRNSAHEMAARDLIRNRTGLPVTCSHELSSKLDGPRRALTTLLNARLIAMITRLIDATEGFLMKRGIAAPLMIVRGDGALVSADFARMRPIETILSGPAASLVGARHMTGLDDAVVSDIGGTTTDIAVLDGGRLRLDPDGATVGGLRTMVEAVAMRTFGLGGDSEVSFDEQALAPVFTLGPRRLVPLALAATRFEAVIHDALKRQVGDSNSGRLDGRFAFRTGVPERLSAGLSATEASLYREIETVPVALDRLLGSASQVATLDRLVRRGLVHVAGFTPSDAAHALGRQDNWDQAAAQLGAELFARRRDGRGRRLADDAETLSRMVLAALTRRSAEAILATVLDEDGLDGRQAVASALVQRALGRHNGMARLSIVLDRPVVGLGASAALHYAGLGDLVGSECRIAEHADVANALGAVVGQVRMSAQARVSEPQSGLFRLNAGTRLEDFPSEEDALVAAEVHVSAVALDLARRAGADHSRVEIARDIKVATVEGRRVLIEAIVVATATGRPRVAS